MTIISRIALRVTGGKFLSFQPDGTVAIRDNPNSPGEPGAFETIEVLLLDGGLPVLPGAEPVTPVHPVDPPTPVDPPRPIDPPRTPQQQFALWVAGKPFGQRTLLELEPTMNAAGWLLTPPNAAGDRTKVRPPNSHWFRVGFGEKKWVWLDQGES